MKRCDWCGSDPLYQAYHDTEWGKPQRHDQDIFEFVVLESAQAGLSWITILKRRETYRQAFLNFNAEKVARWSLQTEWPRLVQSGIIRHRGKVEAAIANAQSFLDIQEAFGGFHQYLWGFVDNEPIVNRWKAVSEIPGETPLSQQIAKDMRSRGFKFWGPTICYAWMQALGVVNDHLVDCHFR